MEKVAIGVPSGSHAVYKWAMAFGALCHWKSDKYTLTNMFSAESCYVHQNRNAITRRFMEECDATWLLQLDTDVTFEPNLIERLLALAEATGGKIVAGWYMTITFGRLVPLVFRRKNDGELVHLIPSGDVPRAVDASGTGCIMVHREVFGKTRLSGAASPWFNLQDKGGKTEIGEDLSFGFRAFDAGYPTWVDPNLRVKHWKLGEL